MKSQIDHQVQYDENERFLINYNRKYVICSDSSTDRENNKLNANVTFENFNSKDKQAHLERKTRKLFKHLEQDRHKVDH